MITADNMTLQRLMQERIAFLQRDRDKLLAQREQLGANINALCGAIDDCEYWLEVVRRLPNQLPDAGGVDAGDVVRGD